MSVGLTKESLLSNSLQIQPSQLFVKDLQKVSSYYRDIVGLESLVSTKSRVVLGYGQVPVIELVSKSEYNDAPAMSAGLFHNAILFQSRSALAKVVLNILQKAQWSYEGSADHLVSEAFYFHDPENNGLELYVDRPREDWKWINGNVQMDTLYLDPQRFILENIQGDVDESKEMGHVHLKVGDVATARRFYVDQLGFDVTVDMGSALFVSVGGYHHHMAMNTWQSRGAGRREPSLGLGEVKLVLPGDSNIDKLADRLTSGKVYFKQQNDNLHVDDPWGNSLVFALAKR